jgi:hypothetical protein
LTADLKTENAPFGVGDRKELGVKNAMLGNACADWETITSAQKINITFLLERKRGAKPFSLPKKGN